MPEQSTALLIVTPGYRLRTGYYFRVVRDGYLAGLAGHEVKTLVFCGRCWRSGEGSPLSWGHALRAIRNADMVVYENVLAGVFAFIRGSQLTQDLYIIHGSLAELNDYSFKHLKRPIYTAILRWVGARVGRVIAVSHALKAHLTAAHSISADRISVVPNLPPKGFVDRMRSLWASSSTAQVKEDLGLNPSRSYLCYAGNTQGWQKIELLLASFALVQQASEEIDLLLLTQNTERMRELCQEYEINASRCIVRSVSNDEIPSYLFASDVLYIVRDDNEINRVACPTKLMEYLASGRTVLYSLGLGDAEALLEGTGRGVALDLGRSQGATDVCKAILEALAAKSDELLPPHFDTFELDRFRDTFLLPSRKAT